MYMGTHIIHSFTCHTTHMHTSLPLTYTTKNTDSKAHSYWHFGKFFGEGGCPLFNSTPTPPHTCSPSSDNIDVHQQKNEL